MPARLSRAPTLSRFGRGLDLDAQHRNEGAEPSGVQFGAPVSSLGSRHFDCALGIRSNRIDLRRPFGDAPRRTDSFHHSSEMMSPTDAALLRPAVSCAVTVTT